MQFVFVTARVAILSILAARAWDGNRRVGDDTYGGEANVVNMR